MFEIKFMLLREQVTHEYSAAISGASFNECSLQQNAVYGMGKRQRGFWLNIEPKFPDAAIKPVCNSIEFKSKQDYDLIQTI
jgi:hypothetical protein